MDPFNDEDEKPATNITKPIVDNRNSSISYDSNKPPLIVRKFLKGGAFEPPPDRDNSIGFRPHHIFLYGTLMNPNQLQKVLQLTTTPALQPATIVGWKIRLWGKYPALVFSPGNAIHGMAYELQKESQMEYLAYYETEAYRLKGCNIKFGDATEVPGETFIWNGDKNLLPEGSFDLKDWQMEQLEKQA